MTAEHGPDHWLGPLDRWRICPSTHCLRSQECRSPHECCGTGKNLTPEQRAKVRAAQAYEQNALQKQEAR
jgi:hypothetical protein